MIEIWRKNYVHEGNYFREKLITRKIGVIFHFSVSIPSRNSCCTELGWWWDPKTDASLPRPRECWRRAWHIETSTIWRDSCNRHCFERFATAIPRIWRGSYRVCTRCSETCWIWTKSRSSFDCCSSCRSPLEYRCRFSPTQYRCRMRFSDLESEIQECQSLLSYLTPYSDLAAARQTNSLSESATIND